MLPLDHDTIAAISTPPGIGGLAVIRLSGPHALATITSLFSAAEKLSPRRATFGILNHPDLASGEFDNCIVTYFKGPHSATGEDLVEISIHGGAYLQQKLIEVLLSAPNIRAASAGEFTLRAFLNGRIDLSRAEAVADLIHAKDAATHEQAINQLGGSLRNLVLSMSKDLIKLLTLIEAELDFSDQEIDFTPMAELRAPLISLLDTTKALLDTYFYGRRLEEGYRVPLIGAPNSGKSSLFNLLLGENRAIVTERPGTTRDTIEKTIIVAGHSVVLIDTAGLRDTDNEAETQGVDRSKEEIETADLLLLVQAPDTQSTTIEKDINTPQILVYNKIDTIPNTPAGKDVYLSCTTGAGLEQLKDLLYSHVINMVSRGVGGVIITAERHLDIFKRFESQLSAALVAIEGELGPEYVASDLRLALDVLGELTGETTPDDILNQIFSGFCVGK